MKTWFAHQSFPAALDGTIHSHNKSTTLPQWISNYCLTRWPFRFHRTTVRFVERTSVHLDTLHLFVLRVQDFARLLNLRHAPEMNKRIPRNIAGLSGHFTGSKKSSTQGTSEGEPGYLLILAWVGPSLWASRCPSMVANKSCSLEDFASKESPNFLNKCASCRVEVGGHWGLSKLLARASGA